ncbi:hypothetical protein FRC06_004631 [Ceratobasidium sp. 370]|nr:hypothetical protein FRC06_004631 [Ceratobasidium sp. 370]
MSSESTKIHPPTHSKGVRRNKGKREEQYPLIPGIRDSERSRNQKLLISTRDALSEISREVSAMNARLAPPPDRIHSSISPDQRTENPPAFNPASTRRIQISGDKENITFLSPPLAMPAPRPAVPFFYASSSQQGGPNAIPRSRKRANSTVLNVSNAPDRRGPMKVAFSESLVAEPSRSTTPPRVPSPYRAKRRTELPVQPRSAYSGVRALTGKLHARFEETAQRYPQGHRTAPRLYAKLPPASRARPEVATAKALENHARETAAEISYLNSQVSSLSSTMAAVLPIVAEARLLWMENTVVQAQTKLGTTRQAFFQYYNNPRYLTYTGNVRARARTLGLTLHDLGYLRERLGSLGEEPPEQRAAHGKVLLSPFGGGNESGDKVMIESFHPGSKHGIYARQIWRVCYERAYSVNEEWSVPIPVPDNSKLVSRIKTWLSSA